MRMTRCLMQYGLFYSRSRFIVIQARSEAVMIMWAFSVEGAWDSVFNRNSTLGIWKCGTKEYKHKKLLVKTWKWPLRGLLIGRNIKLNAPDWRVLLLWELGYNLVSWQEEWSISSISVFGREDECIHGETMFKCFISLFQPVKLSM